MSDFVRTLTDNEIQWATDNVRMTIDAQRRLHSGVFDRIAICKMPYRRLVSRAALRHIETDREGYKSVYYRSPGVTEQPLVEVVRTAAY
jgi:hypothetical protein